FGCCLHDSLTIPLVAWLFCTGHDSGSSWNLIDLTSTLTALLSDAFLFALSSVSALLSASVTRSLYMVLLEHLYATQHSMQLGCSPNNGGPQFWTLSRDKLECAGRRRMIQTRGDGTEMGS
ncbi:hypothetical protein BD311DRAFT_765562, partial [Dichomitus squalens]